MGKQQSQYLLSLLGAELANCCLTYPPAGGQSRPDAKKHTNTLEAADAVQGAPCSWAFEPTMGDERCGRGPWPSITAAPSHGGWAA